MAKEISNHTKPVADSVQFVEQGKILRVLQIIQYIQVPRTLNDIQERFNISNRTAHRYMLLISESGLQVNKTVIGYNKTYFSICIKDNCPFCGKLFRKELKTLEQ